MNKWRLISAVALLALPSLPVHARSQVAIDGQGRLHVFGLAYSGSTKVIQYAYLSPSGWIYRRLNGALKVAPVVATNSQGTIYVVGIGTDDAIYFTEGSGDYFGPWVRMAGGQKGWFGARPPDSAPSVEVNQDGRIEIFVTGTDRYAYHAWENCLGCGTFSWFWLINNTGYNQNNDPAVGRNGDGRLEYFVSPGTSTTGQVAISSFVGHVYQDVPNGGWDPGWQNFYSVDGAFYGQPEIASNQDGRLEIFVKTNSGISHRWQTQPGTWSSWAIFPSSNYFTLGAVAQDRRGVLMLFFQFSSPLSCPGSVNQYDPPCYYIGLFSQLSPNGGWGNAIGITSSNDKDFNPLAMYATDAISTADRKMHVFAYDSYDLRIKHQASNPVFDSSGNLIGHNWSGSWERLW